MPARTFPNIGLKAGYDAHESGWGADMTLNMLKLSVLAQGRVINKVAAEPGSPAANDTYILDETHATHPNEIAVYDNGAWVYFGASLRGWRMWNVTTNSFLEFNGTIWSFVSTPGLPSGGTTGQVLTKQSASDGDADWETPSSGSGGGGADVSTAFLGDFSLWTAAKARGSTNPARFMLLGDSNLMGQGSNTGTNGLVGAFTTSLARKLATELNLQHDSMLGDQNSLAQGSVAYGTYDARAVLGTGWSTTTGTGSMGGQMFTATAGASGKLKLTPTGSFSKFKVWYPISSGLNTALSVYVDGALQETFSQAGTAALASKTYTVSAGTHYIEIGVGATGTGYVSGIEVFDGTDTPIMLQASRSGCKASDLVANSNAWEPYFANVALAPDFCLIYCTIIDAGATTALGTYYDNIETIVKAIHATSNGILCVGWPTNIANAKNGYYEDQARILQHIAKDYGWSFYDVREAVGYSYGRANDQGFAYDIAHPNVSGRNAISAGILGLIQSSL